MSTHLSLGEVLSLAPVVAELRMMTTQDLGSWNHLGMSLPSI